MFTNRIEAGYKLAQAIAQNAIEFDIVLGIPRGGVVTAGVIARQFDCDMDIVASRKIGSPNLPEFAVGAVSPDGKIFVHPRLKQNNNFDDEIVAQIAQRVQGEINRRCRMFRGNRPPVLLKDRKVLLVDDGIATGFTVLASVDYIKRKGASSIAIATPVCPQVVFENLKEQVDQIIVLHTEETFYAVSQYYDDFSPVEDEEVVTILMGHRPFMNEPG
ncbi:phosphoribosyltransferase [Syntrophomonas erecta]